MTGLCGWIGHATTEPDTTLARMVGRLSPFPGAKPSNWAMPDGALGGTGLKHAPVIAQQGGCRAVVIGRPRISDSHLHAYAMQHGHAGALIQGYRKEGPAVLRHFADSFALALVDLDKQHALLAVDRFGSIPLSFSETGNGLIFASSLWALNTHPAANSSIDRQAIYHYLYFHMVPGPETIYHNQFRLEPGEYLHWQNGDSRRKRYWEPVFTESGGQSFVEQKEAFTALLRESMREASAGAETGCFLSGGTDSSTIAGMLTAVQGRPAKTYSIGFEAEGYDEMEFARIAVKHFGTRHTEYYVTPDDVVNAIPRIAAASDQPFGNSSVVPGFYCAQLAHRDGVERMLGGDGGDELFGGNARYAKQHVFEVWGRVPRAVKKSLIEPLAFNLPTSLPLIGKARSYIEQANTPMPARLETYNLLERFGAANIFTRDFLGQVNISGPGQHQQRTWDAIQAQSLINQMLGLDFKYTLADNDLVKVNLACELAGVDIAYPLLHDKLTQFSLKLDPGWKLKGQQLRWFFKEALRDFLPPEIITKEKHGFGLPFGPWLTKHTGLQTLVNDSLSDLKRHDLIRPEFIDDMMSKVREHPGYYGTMVWILMMLSLWLKEAKQTI
ncbi:asparagine synthase (glutamine-hydrolyzing) [Chitinivorax tropicus]|uniref:asparagine synthase (glutamine-hydrolyzing) n=1 Tax=Chitinivorax tropicus TaxID=714531 RepID=A0A840MIS6_9PROT|nr:asparagine synthase-related protein [Chitinivorax tropicus]MBB5018310.1 asparagine synthase (glutamine-hydrolyzing) [Chitinivorax tropicus]